MKSDDKRIKGMLFRVYDRNGKFLHLVRARERQIIAIRSSATQHHQYQATHDLVLQSELGRIDSFKDMCYRRALASHPR